MFGGNWSLLPAAEAGRGRDWQLRCRCIMENCFPLLEQFSLKSVYFPLQASLQYLAGHHPWAPSGCPTSQFKSDTNFVGLAQTLRSKAQSHKMASLYFRCQSQRVGPKLLTFLSVSATNQGFPQPPDEAQ